MPKELREDVVRTVKDQKVEFVHLWFTDVLGFLKSFTIDIEELELAMAEGMGFDGSSILGFARIQESDMIALPDPTTLQILPWRTGGDIVSPDGAPYEADPRYVLKRQLKRAADMGYSFFIGPELEYYYLRDDHSTEVLDHATYFDQTTRDLSIDLRKDTVRALKRFGIQVEYSHHEVGPSQHEIDLRYCEASTRRSCPSRSSARLAAGCTCISRCSRATRMPSTMRTASTTCPISRGATWRACLCTHVRSAR
jgi:glutamine synthetase